MNDNYIRKELYEAGMKEIRAIFEASIAKQEAIAERIERKLNEMQKDFQAAKHQYEKDSVKRGGRYCYLFRKYNGGFDWQGLIPFTILIFTAIAIILHRL